MVKRALSDEEILACFDVLIELRPHLEKDGFLDLIRKMENEAYQLVYIEKEGQVVAVAGFRIYTNLFMGKHLYVDDLVTAEAARSKGYGESMIKWLREKAIHSDCNYFHLDSGTHRGQAHKFYFKQGFTIASYHFSEKLLRN